VGQPVDGGQVRLELESRERSAFSEDVVDLTDRAEREGPRVELVRDLTYEPIPEALVDCHAHCVGDDLDLLTVDEDLRQLVANVPFAVRDTKCLLDQVRQPV